MRYIIGIIWSIGFMSLSAQGIFNENTLSTAILLPEEDINTATYEFAPVFFGEYIAFVYDKGNSLYYDEVYNTPYFDMAFAAKNTLGNLARRASFVPNLSSEYQEGPFCFFNKEKSMLFTRTDPVTGQLSIYRSDLSDSGWSEGMLIELLGRDFHTCHPSVSESGDMLVFAGASIAEGSNMDLYIASREGQLWTDVQLLDEDVNSSENDWFPRFVGDSIIVYATMDEALDIYATKMIEGKWSVPERAPDPINSAGDDFGLILGDGIAYFSSNREGSKGNDDLYRIEFKGELFSSDLEKVKTTVIITLQDKLTLQPIEDAKILVTPTVNSLDDVDLSRYQIDLIPQQGGQGEIVLKLKPKDSGPSQAVVTDEQGNANILTNEVGSYLLEITHPEYNPYTTIIDYSTMGGNITLVMEPVATSEDQPEGILIPTTTGSVVVFENIYYDFNSHVILDGAATELDALVLTMKSNPRMMVELSAHTDSRGTRLYNQRLSEKRAASARDYLIRNGINPSRITTMGYGESSLRNDCSDGVTCTEEQHRFNRRTEVKILSN
ncbi:MAG: OmpA family protein [Saprospiraceae bacterium]|nr:OmpA family protein [Saprospiraceae bacterium]